MTKRIFYCDIDGVLLNLEATIRHVLSKELNLDLLDPVRTSSFEEYYGISKYVLGAPSDPPNRIWSKIYDQPLDAFMNAITFVKELQDLNFEVIGLSHRVGIQAADASKRELEANRIPLDNVVFVNSAQEKLGYLGFGKAYIDDLPHFAANAGTTGAQTFLISRPWNLQSADLGNYVRVSNLLNIKGYLA
jgi:hypothetical protein